MSAAVLAADALASTRGDAQPAAEMKSASSRPSDLLVDDIDPSEKVSDMLIADAWLCDCECVSSK
jgi:hypothetical protein